MALALPYPEVTSITPSHSWWTDKRVQLVYKPVVRAKLRLCNVQRRAVAARRSHGDGLPGGGGVSIGPVSVDQAPPSSTLMATSTSGGGLDTVLLTALRRVPVRHREVVVLHDFLNLDLETTDTLVVDSPPRIARPALAWPDGSYPCRYRGTAQKMNPAASRFGSGLTAVV